MVWPVEGYTDKIHTSLATIFATYSWLSYTKDQLISLLMKEFDWLNNPTDHQKKLLSKIVLTGIKKLIQSGAVRQVISKVSVSPQWIAVTTDDKNGYTSVTSQDEVAQTENAKKASTHRSIGARKLWELNHKG